jgi:hypothetical protein
VPYVGHLLVVAGTVLEHGGDEDETAAARCTTRSRTRRLPTLNELENLRRAGGDAG